MIQTIVPELQKILDMPKSVLTDNNENFRDTGILRYILSMVQRGDSKETIMDVYLFLNQ